VIALVAVLARIALGSADFELAGAPWYRRVGIVRHRANTICRSTPQAENRDCQFRLAITTDHQGLPTLVTIAYNMKAKLSRMEVIATFSTRIAKEVPDQGNPSLVSI